MASEDLTPDEGGQVEEALQKAAAAIGAARTLLDQGNVVDLEGLEAHVESACDAIPALESDEKDRLKPALVALIDGLNGLSEELTSQHAEIAGTLNGLSTRQRAMSAYGPRKP